ncbi:uncharacterized protein PHALS_01430 [Plasmopara halstedii]|uniref:Cilia-and flagella-associated protein 96 n=1 Tax=Plasmopara halstedii TaxID=4781 RepID=A0A0P1ATT3_PLAHL|nr:uncharacterized protein PHALS_01430 [Plasmopara halstedii]CEG45106.1 hypothetical protein PHALS_01430 [Plasmopara halstedii]|eukprot:XP_024581475.1 hypothetical protein PHALS_01430 [Plasmopara halstedii]
MYSTKVLNKNIAESYLTIGDPYRDPHIIEGKSSRHKGKQIFTVPAKDTSNGLGYFEKKSYTSDPLQDNTAYLKSQPMDTRKSGFGSKDASRRDEFMSHIRTEQYRETLHTENKILDKQKQKDPPYFSAALNSLNQSRDFPEGLCKTKHLYDIGRSQNTEFNQKSHRDTFYTMRAGNSQYKRNNGPFMLTSESIGLGADDVANNRPTPKGASTKQFFDHSHLHT